MSNAPLMPKATAIWLVENTSLTFNQIAAFCKLHPLEVKGIADGEVGAGIRGHDPITSGQLTREEIAKGEADPEHELKLAISKVRLPEAKPRRGAADVADTRDHRKRRFRHELGIGRHDRIRARADEGRRERAEVPGAVVGEHDLHAAPLVERMPAPPGATA